jgi:hypothetical protein
MSIVYYNDLDRETIYGTKAVGVPEDIDQRNTQKIEKIMMWAKLFIGVVDKVRNDEQMVDIIYGSKNEITSAPKQSYERVKIIGSYGVDETGEFWGRRRLPKLGSEVLCAFVGMQEEHPVILGGIITERDKDVIAENESDGTDENEIFVNGLFKMTVYPDGQLNISNDEYTLTIDKDGNVDIVASGDYNIDASEINFNNGTKGVARLDDAVKVNITATQIAGLGLIAGPYPVTAPVPLNNFDANGKIIESSNSVKAGD